MQTPCFFAWCIVASFRITEWSLMAVFAWSQQRILTIFPIDNRKRIVTATLKWALSGRWRRRNLFYWFISSVKNIFYLIVDCHPSGFNSSRCRGIKNFLWKQSVRRKCQVAGDFEFFLRLVSQLMTRRLGCTGNIVFSLNKRQRCLCCISTFGDEV